AANGPRCLVYGVQTAGAKAVHGHPADRVGQAGQQRAHAGHIAVVLAGLIGTAEIDFFNYRRIDTRPGDQFLDYERGQIIRPRVRQRTAVAADCRPHTVDDYYVIHDSPLFNPKYAIVLIVSVSAMARDIVRNSDHRENIPNLDNKWETHHDEFACFIQVCFVNLEVSQYIEEKTCAL